MLDPALLELMPDEITIEPWESTSVTQAHVYGTSVTYAAQVVSEYERVIDKNGRDLKSTARAIIPDRVHIDPRSRITLPTGWVPNQPSIMAVRPVGGALGLDSTEILFSVLLTAALLFGNVAPSLAAEDAADAHLGNTVSVSDSLLAPPALFETPYLDDSSRRQFGEPCTFTSCRVRVLSFSQNVPAVDLVLAQRHPFKIDESIVPIDAIFVIRVVSWWTRPDEREKNQPVYEISAIASLFLQVHIAVSNSATRPGEAIFSYEAGPLVVGALPYSAERTDIVEPVVTWNIFPLLFFQVRFGDVFRDWVGASVFSLVSTICGVLALPADAFPADDHGVGRRVSVSAPPFHGFNYNTTMFSPA